MSVVPSSVVGRIVQYWFKKCKSATCRHPGTAIVPKMNPISLDTRSLSRGHEPGMGYPGDPASSCRHWIRGRPGSAALVTGATRGCSGLAASDLGASPIQPDADGRSGWGDPL